MDGQRNMKNVDFVLVFTNEKETKNPRTMDLFTFQLNCTQTSIVVGINMKLSRHLRLAAKKMLIAQICSPFVQK